ncbi:magnesium transporter [Fulvimarina endophytica]|nr:magnesium transporter [Fulvimarina endophytica]
MQDIAALEGRALEDWLEEAKPHLAVQRTKHVAPSTLARAMTLISPEKAARIFDLLSPATQSDILQALPPPERARFLERMEPDDRARMLEFVPPEFGRTLLEALSSEERALTRTVLDYPAKSAGRLMSPEFVSLMPEMSAEDALLAIRSGEKRADTVFLMPVCDAEMRLLGAVDLAQIVLAAPSTRISDLSTLDVPFVHVTDDQEDVARLMTSADLMIVPVIEEDGRLVGIVTFDDAMEVLDFENSEDFARAGGTEPIGRPYLSVPVFRLVRSRIVWLSVLAVAASLTVNVLDAFEETLESVVTLALFIPLLIGIGGNAGAQSATTIVRALAVEDVKPGDILAIAWRETRTGFVMGLLVSVFAYAILALIFDPSIALVVAVTLVFICTLAALVGAVMPVAAKVLSIDPAVFSAPFVTTIVDASGLLIYFLVARVILGV